MPHYRFHVNVFGNPFHCSWEESAEKLQALPRMIFEPDGSWIWSGGVGKTRWQIDGHLFDFDGALHRVELHGDCPADSFDVLLGCFGWPDQQLHFEQVREGDGLDEAAFRSAVTLADEADC